MRFDCGETYQEQEARLTQWHRWFAWYPVHVGPHDCRWLEFVERRMEYVGSYAGGCWVKEYR